METNYNSVIISGKIDEVEYSHTVSGERYYRTMIHSRRFSGILDNIPVILSESMRDKAQIKAGEDYLIHARLCSRDDKTNGKPRLRLSLVPCKIIPIRGEINCNTIELEGYVCKGPLFRTSKTGMEICQLTVATNYNDRASYIPCVAFELTGLELAKYNIGDKITIEGRVQSRDYLTKDLREGTTYEIAIKSAK